MWPDSFRSTSSRWESLWVGVCGGTSASQYQRRYALEIVGLLIPDRHPRAPERVAPPSDAAVLDWFASVPDDALFLSALTRGEIRKGAEKLRLWLEHYLRYWFGPRIGYPRFDCRHSGG